MSFGRRILEAMAGHGDRLAMVSDLEQVSYAQAVGQVGHLAANLAAAGVGPGDRVGLAMQDALDVILAILACWRLDATPAVIDFRAPHAQRARLARDFDLAVMFESRAAPAEHAYPAMVFEREWRFASRPVHMVQAECSNPAFLGFSSGTTGDPKAYIHTHEMLMRRVGTEARLADRAAPRFLSPMSMSFSATRGYTLAVLYVGGTIRLFPPLFKTSELIEGLLAFKAGSTSLPPPVIARLVSEAGVRSSVLFPDLAELRSIGGPARPEDKIAAYRYLTPGYRMGYASSLTGRISLLTGEDVLAKPESSGRLLRDVRVDILGEDGKPLPPGESGVIRAWTKAILPFFLQPGNKPFVDPKVMGPDWGIPGDIGVLDEDGFITIVDRMEDMILRGGVNVAPQELEKLIRSHPKVTDVAVAGVPDEVMGQEIVAFVVSEAGVTVGELRRFLNTNVSPEQRPREVLIVPSLPYNDNGKLLRRVLIEDLLRERQPISS